LTRRATAFLTCAVAILAGRALHAQEPAVISQTVTVDGRAVADPAVLDLVETRPGKPFSQADVRESIAHLVGLGRFEDVVVSRDAVPGGLALTYALIPSRVVRSIAFKGDVGLPDRDLHDRVKEHFGNTPSLARLQDLLAYLKTVYREEGYDSPALTARPALEGPARDELVIDVKAGSRLRIRHIQAEGNTPDGLGSISSKLRLTTGDVYRKAEVDNRLNAYVTELRARGYYEARADHELTPTADGTTGDVIVNIDAGAHVTVVFEGDDVPPRPRRDLVPIEREGSLDEDLLEDSANRIRGYFQAQGCRDADVSYTRTPRDGELAVVFQVKKGPQFHVAKVDVTGVTAIPAVDLAPRLKTKAGEPFVQSTVDADVATIEEAYHRRGYTQVKATPTVLPVPGGGSPVPVSVELAVVEGAATIVSSIEIVGAHAVAEADLRAGLGSKPGQAFYAPQVALDRDAIVFALLNRGYKSAAVDARVRPSSDRTRAAIVFTVSEGAQVFVGHILVVGNVRTSADTIRRELELTPGQPLSYSGVSDSQRKISALGLFRRVKITELDLGTPNERDLLVAVEEAPTTTLGYGGGVEGGRVLRQDAETGAAQEVFEIAPRGFVEFGRRNLFGKNQSLNLFARAALRSRATTSAIEPGEPPPTGFTFRDYRVLGTYRAPKAFSTPADFLLTGFLEQGVRSSFDFTRKGARVELARHITQALSVSGRYVIERDNVFDERFDPADQPLIDRLFPQVRLSTVSGSVIRDTRDDALAPSRGELLGVDGDLAARAIGSEVGFIKLFTQGFMFRRLPGRRGVIFAGGARLGIATGFERTVAEVDADGNPILGPDGEPVVQTVTDLPASERFFAGGDTSVRGYALDRLGTAATIDRNGFPVGGNAVIVLNGELRIPVWKDIGVVGFVDAGNVWSHVSDFAFGDIRPTTGFGVRYKSPIGPLRVDLGFKLARQTQPDGSLERLTALHISLGQAF
jgi:outer membrane protein assembly complex protein YaeT